MDASERILDANLNRARETLRVMEDCARFELEDVELSTAAKHLRHDLAKAVNQAGLSHLVAARDIVGDIGTAIGVEAEYQRGSLAEVAAAAGKRLSEALRVIEEVGKVGSSSFGGAVEQLRYRAYDLERRLNARLNPPTRLEKARLYVLLTEALCKCEWRETAEATLRGGADLVQLREKGLDDSELLERAAFLTGLCREWGALCIINDRPDIAVLAGADGVHVGQDDLAVAAARRIVGGRRIVGVSSHSPEQASEALAAGPDYLAVGPMFSSTTKQIADIPGPALLEQVRGQTSLPLVAIGGITPENAEQVLRAGCNCLCVCSAVIGKADVELETRRLRELAEAHFNRQDDGDY